VEVIDEKERKALNHYNNNVSYYDENIYINASMKGVGLEKMFINLGINIVLTNSVLDFGCGVGGTIEYILNKTKGQLTPKMLGIDYSINRIDQAKKILSGNEDRLILVAKDVNIWLEEHKDVTFDVILAFEIIEHLSNPEKVVEQLKNRLSNGGTLICTIPYQDKPNDVHLSAFKNESDVNTRLKLSKLTVDLRSYMRFPNQNVFFYKNA
jgi:2-polyprenyl-3-methyl-5-hydroxy-6-metoxy-1,4-benzoquinol methylase